MCLDCNLKAAKAANIKLDKCMVFTCHEGTCEVCGKPQVTVTTPGDYSNPPFDGFRKSGSEGILFWD